MSIRGTKHKWIVKASNRSLRPTSRCEGAFQESFPNLLYLVTAPNDGVKVTCDEQFYFKIDEVFDVGGTVSILAANSSYSICLNQASYESCPEEVTLESGKEGILTEAEKKGVNEYFSRLLLRPEKKFF